MGVVQQRNGLPIRVYDAIVKEGERGRGEEREKEREERKEREEKEGGGGDARVA